MINSRRDFLKHAFAVMGGISLPGLVPSLQAAAQSQLAPAVNAGAPPMRFIFMHRGNGLFPKSCVPPSLGAAEKEKEDKNQAFEVALDNQTLPPWMSSLEQHKKHLTILQGISGKMCTVGHHSWCSALGVYKANERPSSIKWATVDFELAKLFPSPLEHLEVACFPTGGGNPRAGLDGIAMGFSARGQAQPNYAFGSPGLAVQEIFKSVSTDKNEQIKYQLERKILDFAVGHESELAKYLNGIEQTKISSYAGSIQDIRERNRKIDLMADVVRQHVPKLESKYLAAEMTTLDRQLGHVEVLLASLVSGLTNVVAFTVDELGHPYTGLPGLEHEVVNMHDVGHNKAIGGVAALDIRDKANKHHMDLMAKIVSRLKAVPEGKGTMFDNTMIFYFPDGGESHHSHGTEFPMIIMSGSNAKPKWGNQYIRLPYWGTPGHKTLGNLWTTVLNANGNPVKHFGDLDPTLKMDQQGPIKQFLA